jgi:hypothetical protein
VLCVFLLKSVVKIKFKLYMLVEFTGCAFNKIKVKVTLSLCLIEHYVMKTWGCGGIPCTFLTSALGGGGWPASHSGSFIPGEELSVCI